MSKENKIKKIKREKAANRLSKYGKAGPHSSKKGNKGYVREKKEEKEEEWIITKLTSVARRSYILQHNCYYNSSDNVTLQCYSGEVFRYPHDCIFRNGKWYCNKTRGCGKEVPTDIQLFADLCFCDKGDVVIEHEERYERRRNK